MFSPLVCLSLYSPPIIPQKEFKVRKDCKDFRDRHAGGHEQKNLYYGLKNGL